MAVEDRNKHFIVSSANKSDRLDVFIEDQLKDWSRSQIKKLIENGHVLVKQKKVKAGYALKTGDKISVTLPAPVAAMPAAEAIPLDVLYEDRDIIVINKPSGIAVHPGAGRQSHTLVNALLHHCRDLSGIGGVKRPGIVHRLDQDTSGVMVVAKNDAAHQSLSRQFKDRKVKKVYAAIVRGCPRADHGVIELPIGRHPSDRKRMTVAPLGRARRAVTRFEVRERRNTSALLYCYPETGRTHQIRVHLLSRGHPILGDVIYNPKSTAPRLMLHAFKLEFLHPRSQVRLKFQADIPREMRLYRQRS